jgi:hypothetical protein
LGFKKFLYFSLISLPGIYLGKNITALMIFSLLHAAMAVLTFHLGECGQCR